MAEKKTTTKKATKNKAAVATYNGKDFEILEQNERQIKLTDGTIHFWARTEDVTVR